MFGKGGFAMKKLLMIVNPVAGQKRMRASLLDVITTLSGGGYESTVLPTARRGDAVEFAKRAAEFDLVVICGGDGTLNEVIDGMLSVGATTPVGYIPCGSTNDFGSSMGLPLDVRRAAKVITGGMPHPLDIGKMCGRIFSYVASFGAFTATSYNAPQEVKNVLGHAAYVLEGIRDLPSIRPYRLSFETADGKTYKGDYVFGAIANSTSFGGVIHLKEELVSTNDGLFEVLLIKMPKNLIEFNTILNSLSNSEFNNKCCEFFKSSSLKITSEVPIAWSLDGEYLLTEGTVEMTTLRGAVNLVK